MTASNEVPGDVCFTTLRLLEYCISMQKQQWVSTDNYLDINLVKKNYSHLRYLAPEIVTLSIFDGSAPIEFKSNIAQVVLEVDNGERPEEKNKHKTYVIN